jgi:hypothetical protein
MIRSGEGSEDGAVLGRQVERPQPGHEFSLDRHVPTEHPLRRIDEVPDLSWLRAE